MDDMALLIFNHSLHDIVSPKSTKFRCLPKMIVGMILLGELNQNQKNNGKTEIKDQTVISLILQLIFQRPLLELLPGFQNVIQICCCQKYNPVRFDTTFQVTLSSQV